MKVTIEDIKEEEGNGKGEGWDYPCCGIGKSSKIIIFFKSEGVGTVLSASLSSTWIVGEQERNIEMEFFTKLVNKRIIIDC